MRFTYAHGKLGRRRGDACARAARSRRAARWMAAVSGVLALVLVCGVAVGAPASSKRAVLALAARLAAEDPGAGVGGDTIVATGDGAKLFGVPRRPNFIFALGPNEVVFGGQDRDEIRALAANATVHSGNGSNFVWAGQGARVFGGTGRNMLIASGSRGTVWVRSRNTKVVMYGGHGRVLCSPGARGALIYVRGDDSVGPTCRRVGARVLPVSRVHGASPGRALGGAGPVSGDGSNGNPYVAPCDDPQDVDCTVSGFPVRTLDGLHNEFVPAYKCPADHPYRSIYNFIDSPNGPFGWAVGPGVGVQEDWGDYPIALSITGYSYVQDSGSPGVLWTGTQTGFPNSSATNWNTKSHWYRVVLHCTSDRCHGTAGLAGDRGGPDPNNGDPPDNCSNASQAAAKRWSRLLAASATARTTESSTPASHDSPSAPRAGPRIPPD